METNFASERRQFRNEGILNALDKARDENKIFTISWSRAHPENIIDYFDPRNEALGKEDKTDLFTRYITAVENKIGWKKTATDDLRKDFLEILKATKLPYSETTISTEKALSRSYKSLMNNNLENIKFLTSAELIKKVGMTKFQATCGMDGMAPNAGRLTSFVDNDFFICPGALIYFKSQSRELDTPPKKTLSSLSFLIGHELGHAIDNKDAFEMFNKFYKSFTECLEALVVPRDLHHKAFQDGTREIIADFWGAKQLAKTLKGLNSDTLEQANTLRDSLEFMCNLPGDASHPSTEARLKMMLTNESLAAAISCKKDTYCGLEDPKTSTEGTETELKRNTGELIHTFYDFGGNFDTTRFLEWADEHPSDIQLLKKYAASLMKTKDPVKLAFKEVEGNKIHFLTYDDDNNETGSLEIEKQSTTFEIHFKKK
jgi:hypothetical protein